MKQPRVGILSLQGDFARHRAALDVEVERNAYGRQIDSFTEDVDVSVIEGPMHGVFIRAPRIRSVGAGVEVIARRRVPAGAPKGTLGEPIGVRRGATVGICFHPELTTDLRFHRWFLTEAAGLSLPGAPEQAMAHASGGASA